MMNFSTKTILDRLTNKIAAATIDPLPTDNIYMEELFEPEVYRNILDRMPHREAFDYLEHKDAMRPDGTSTRLALDLTDSNLIRFKPEIRDFWRMMKDVFASDILQQAILKKFATKLGEQYGAQLPELVSVPLLLRDFPGYHISIHPDAPYKLATFQFYFPSDESQIHLGTSFHLREEKTFRHYKTNAFKPNSGYAFVRTSESWHSVQKLEPNEMERNTLALIIYKKGEEYKSGDRY